MPEESIADIILILHFLIVVFITSLFFLIPIGWKLGWKWIKRLEIRLLHLSLMTVVTIETIIGITCPLTIIENYLRGVYVSNTFISIYLSKIIFWEFPPIFFIILYVLCFIWTVFIWFKFPPENLKKKG